MLYGFFKRPTFNRVFLFISYKRWWKKLGKNWNWITQTYSTSFNTSVAFGGTGYGVITGSDGTLLYSENNSRNWTKAEKVTTKQLQSVAFIDSITAVAVGYDWVMTRTEDGGKTWQKIFTTPSKAHYAANQIKFADEK